MNKIVCSFSILIATFLFNSKVLAECKSTDWKTIGEKYILEIYNYKAIYTDPDDSHKNKYKKINSNFLNCEELGKKGDLDSISIKLYQCFDKHSVIFLFKTDEIKRSNSFFGYSIYTTWELIDNDENSFFLEDRVYNSDEFPRNESDYNVGNNNTCKNSTRLRVYNMKYAAKPLDIFFELHNYTYLQGTEKLQPQL